MWYIIYQTEWGPWKLLEPYCKYKTYEEACYFRDYYWKDKYNVTVINKQGMKNRVEGMNE